MKQIQLVRHLGEVYAQAEQDLLTGELLPETRSNAGTEVY